LLPKTPKPHKEKIMIFESLVNMNSEYILTINLNLI